MSTSALETFWTDGFTMLPRLFAAEEIGWLAEEARGLAARLSGRPKQPVPSWVGDEAPEGTLFDIDVYEEPFRRLMAHPRLLTQVRALLPEPLYVYRTRLIGERPAKDAIWRRDMPTWRRLAGISAPRLITAAVSLSDHADAPALFVQPGSQGMPATAPAPRPLVLPLGSVALLHGDLSYAFHAERPAAGPIFLITYNALANQPAFADQVGVGSFRPRPLDAVLGDDCLWPPAFACAG